MKKLLLIAILTTLPAMAHAAISVEQQTNRDYVQKNGYSEQTADAISVVKARANGETYYAPDEARFRNHNWFVKFWRKLYVYTDPAAEDYSFYHHDTDTTPSYTDF